ncbi:MAG TPA: SDR family NAD(P)-dependent oxidoreductase, partial [Burkholderiales bacterium]|nr:SDR family NAD(P)-dependent oxidoreductase [Burkholderiales bacterium]
MNKVALVTGGSSGIGEATVKELGRRGWHVAGVARKRIEKPDVLFIQGDVAEDPDCRRVAKAVLEKWGRI